MQDLADRAGLQRGHIHNLERGKNRNPTLDTLLRLQSAFELASLELLLGGLSGFPSWQLTMDFGPPADQSA